jgi:hypothetical protein
MFGSASAEAVIQAEESITRVTTNERQTHVLEGWVAIQFLEL